MAFMVSFVSLGDNSDTKMRLLLAIIVIIYLVGVGVVLSPIIRSTWNSRARVGIGGPCRSGAARRSRLAGQSSARLRRLLMAASFYDSMIATARVQPAEARSILVGKQQTVKPVDGSASRLCNFSIWQ